MKFRKKPVVVEAVQWDGTNENEVIRFMRQGMRVTRDSHGGATAFRLETLEGDMLVSCGDWIIRGIKGELYACKPEIFEATYEPLPPPGGGR